MAEFGEESRWGAKLSESADVISSLLANELGDLFLERMGLFLPSLRGLFLVLTGDLLEFGLTLRLSTLSFLC